MKKETEEKAMKEMSEVMAEAVIQSMYQIAGDYSLCLWMIEQCESRRNTDTLFFVQQMMELMGYEMEYIFAFLDWVSESGIRTRKFVKYFVYYMKFHLAVHIAARQSMIHLYLVKEKAPCLVVRALKESKR